MVYRERSAAAAGEMVYGPFHIRLGGLCAGILLTAVALLLGAFALTIRDSPFMAIFALLMGAMGASFAVTSMRGIGRITLRLRAGVLHATRSIFGVPLRRWELPVHDAEQVDIQWSNIDEFWQRAHTPGACAGALVISHKSGLRQVVNGQAFRGYHVHLRARDQLHALLDLEPEPVSVVERRAAAAADRKPAAVMGGGWGANIGLGWLGMCCGWIAGMALLGLFGLSMGWWKAHDGISPLVMIVGGGGGALGGILLAFWLRRRAESR